MNFFWSYQQIQEQFTGIKYGALYNRYAVLDSRKISSSDDWAIPTRPQLESLVTYLGGSSVAGGKLKETGTVYWDSPNSGATNEVGFNGRGSGWRIQSDGNFANIIKTFYIWTATPYSNPAYSYDFQFSYNNTNTVFDVFMQTAGLSVRLIYTGAGTPTYYQGNDLKKYRLMTQNGIIYLADNLAETKFRNGDWITGYDGGTYTPISNVNWAAKITEAMCIYGDVESNMLL